MRDRGWILIGLLIGLGLLTFPIWYNSAAGTDSSRPELKKAVEGSECIYGTEYMRANHMDVLMDWRDEVVRNGNRYVEIGGKKVEMSLTRTCMGCHADAGQFCTKCHDYSGVDPYCWDCHVPPEDASHTPPEGLP
ncbi:MAG: cytochrome C [bacterium]|nr:cytochrome C [bacterium]